jgi:hypothetical protein
MAFTILELIHNMRQRHTTPDQQEALVSGLDAILCHRDLFSVYRGSSVDAQLTSGIPAR